MRIFLCLLLMISLSCNSDQEFSTARVVHVKGKIVNDTLIIKDSEAIKTLKMELDNAQTKPSKFAVNIWIEFIADTTISKYGVNGKYFKTNEGQFVSDKNLEEIIINMLDNPN